MKQLSEDVRTLFANTYCRQPEVVAAAPGRLELLGNHTDYNEGYILGIAIDRYILVAGSRTDNEIVSIHSSEFNQTIQFPLNRIAKDPHAVWANYPKGVISQLKNAGHRLGGCSLAIQGNIPLGSGVSSSAALLIATVTCLNRLFGITIEPMLIAQLGQRAEKEFAGANTGVLDHFCSVFGKKDHALFLDCRSLDHERYPIAADNLSVVICNTHVKHSIVEGEYKERREQCKAAAEFFKQINPSVSTLRDINSELLDTWKEKMDPIQYKRASHIVGENERVLAGMALLKTGKLKEFGKLLYASHESSTNNFENSCKELDIMVGIARSVKGVWGARLSGGGFGGVVLAFVKTENVQDLRAAVMKEYRKQTDIVPDVFACKISDGAQIL
jgi:galactokinase